MYSKYSKALYFLGKINHFTYLLYFQVLTIIYYSIGSISLEKTNTFEEAITFAFKIYL